MDETRLLKLEKLAKKKWGNTAEIRIDRNSDMFIIKAGPTEWKEDSSDHLRRDLVMTVKLLVRGDDEISVTKAFISGLRSK